MGRIDVRVPDDQEKLINQLSDTENYGSRSEFVREAIRNEIRERVDLSHLQEAKKRLEEIEDGGKTVSHEDVEEQAGIDGS